MKYLKKFQAGGLTAGAAEQIAQLLVLGGMDDLSAMQYADAFILIAGGEEQAVAALQLASLQGALPEQLVQTITLTVQLAMQQQLGSAQMARNGAKLLYIKQLKGKCPEGMELIYMKRGGVVCPKCVAKQKAAKAACGKKLSNGGDTKAVAAFKAKCGGSKRK